MGVWVGRYVVRWAGWRVVKQVGRYVVKQAGKLDSRLFRGTSRVTTSINK